jgi:hypothetical protein
MAAANTTAYLLRDLNTLAFHSSHRESNAGRLGLVTALRERSHQDAKLS